MRKDFNELCETTQNYIKEGDDLLSQLVKLLNEVPCRESSIAFTHLETGMMWANKAFVKHDVIKKHNEKI